MTSHRRTARLGNPFLVTMLATVIVGTHAKGDGGAVVPLTWSRDVRASVALAQATDRPIMILIGSSPLTYEQLYQHGRRGPAINPFADPRVIDAARPFVALQVPQGHGTARDLLGDRIPARVDRVLVLLTPQGDALGQYGITGAPESLATELRLASRAYGRMLFDEKLKRVLKDEQASEQALRRTVDKVREFEIVEADDAVIAVAERAELGSAMRKQVYGTLGYLSTQAAVDYLIDRAVQGDKAEASLAALALQSLRLSSTAPLVQILEKSGPRERVVAYRTLVRLLQVPKPRPDRFWESADERSVEQEVERINKLAEQRVGNSGEPVEAVRGAKASSQPTKKRK